MLIQPCDLVSDLQCGENDSHLKPEAEIIPLASIDSAVKRCSLSSIDLYSLYRQEVRCVH